MRRPRNLFDSMSLHGIYIPVGPVKVVDYKMRKCLRVVSAGYLRELL